MAAPITDESTALARLMSMLQYGSDPALTAQETGDILDRHIIAGTWTADTAYRVGDRVVPTTLNGWMYECEESGSSSETTEPDWPEVDTYEVDDNGIEWRLCGLQPGEALWDLRAAAYEGWMMKAGKVAGTGKITAGRLSVDGGSVREACLAQARLYAPVGVA